MAKLNVGSLAKQAGVNPQTIHYYERRGLLPAPPRNGANYRSYPENAVLRVRFIKRAQQLGFTLNEIKELLALRASPDSRCTDIRIRAEAKLQDIDDKTKTLQSMSKALSALIDQCTGKAPVTQCPILAALDTEEDH